MRFILEGTKLVYGAPRLWRFIWRPFALGALWFCAVSIVAFLFLAPRLALAIEHPFGHSPPWPITIASSVFAEFFVATLFVLVSGTLYLLFVSFCSSTMWEKLSLEVEIERTGNRIETKLPISAIVRDTILRGSFALAITLLSLCCGWTIFGLPAIFLAGYLGLHDYTSAVYLRRGVTFPDQMRFVRSLHGIGSFVVVSGLLTLVPVVNVLMLPCLVAAGTLMVVDSESAAGRFGR